MDSLKAAVESDGGVPLPPNLKWFVKDNQQAIELGKALFWDMQVGSDGVQACASCHFSAGADIRSKNQLNPNITRMGDQHEGRVTGYHNAPGAGGDLFEIVSGSLDVVGPNYQLEREDFPFVREPNEWIRNRDILDPATPDNSNDTVSSMASVRTKSMA